MGVSNTFWMKYTRVYWSTDVSNTVDETCKAACSIVIGCLQDLPGEQELLLPQVLDDLLPDQQVCDRQGVDGDVVGVGCDEGLEGGRHVGLDLQVLLVDLSELAGVVHVVVDADGRVVLGHQADAVGPDQTDLGRGVDLDSVDDAGVPRVPPLAAVLNAPGVFNKAFCRSST